MRLIDADSFDDFLDEYNRTHELGITRVEYKRFSNVLFEMPTIEAIPLSFIRDEVERLDKCKLTELADYMRNVLKYYDAVQRGEETW